MKYVYGPVPSRRFGSSLGVNPVLFKTCSYSCVYCQLGWTQHMTAVRSSFFPPEDILAEIEEAANNSRLPVDYITFVGEGEPTLNSDLGFLIREAGERTKRPVAVITNGSLLWREDVRQDLMNADVVSAELDAGTDGVFREINRPHPSLSLDEIVGGIAEFRREFEGRLWIQVMLVEGRNCSEEELLALRDRIEVIKPERVYIDTPIRPPAEGWVKPAGPECLVRAHDILSDFVGIESMDITSPETGLFDSSAFSGPEEALISLSKRHPLREEQAVQIISSFSDEIDSAAILTALVSARKLGCVEYNGRTYYISSEIRRA